MIYRIIKYVLLCSFGILSLIGCQSDDDRSSADSAEPGSSPAPSESIERNIGLPGRQTLGEYVLFADFTAYQGDILIQDDSIKVYSVAMDEEFMYSADLMDERVTDEDHPYLLSVYYWEDDKFVLMRNDSLRHHPAASYAIDKENSIDEPIENTAVIRAISQVRERLLIKHQAEADLNNDGVAEYILVYSHPKTGEFGYFYGIIILEQSGGRYIIAYQYTSDFESYVGEFLVQDVTGDAQPELILYESDFGASGYTVYAQIFGADKGQPYLVYDIE